MTSVEDIVGSFDSISLDEMDRVALMDRVDTKYLFGTEQLPTLLQTMTAGYQVLRVEDIRISSYSTLYFDTPRHDFFLQHHNGKLNRHKIRMRKYLLSNTCFLEMKTKNNKGRTTKRRIQIEDFEETFSPKSVTFLRSVMEDLPELVPQLQSGFSGSTGTGHARFRYCFQPRQSNRMLPWNRNRRSQAKSQSAQLSRTGTHASAAHRADAREQVLPGKRTAEACP